MISLYTKMAGNYKLAGDLESAVKYSEKVYKLIKKLVGKVSSRSLVALKNVGILLFEWKKFEESQKVFEKCVKRIELLHPE